MSKVKLVDTIRLFFGKVNSAHIFVILLALYESVMITRLLLAPNIANPTLYVLMQGTGWGTQLFVMIVVGAVIGIWFCDRWPLWILIVETTMLLITAALFGSACSYLMLIWAVSVFFAASKIEKRLLQIIAVVCAGLLGLVSLLLATLLHHDGNFLEYLYPFTLLFLLFAGFGILAENIRERRQSERALLGEQERGEKLAWQRDQALKQSRIAAELHDSVGHDLTAIIALSEGLDGVGDNPETNDAICMINDLARQGLADTRTAVKALQPGGFVDGDKNANQENSYGSKQKAGGVAENGMQGGNAPVLSARVELHDWDDIEPILGHSRQIGITTALTETGRRLQDQRQADLSLTSPANPSPTRYGMGRESIESSFPGTMTRKAASPLRCGTTGNQLMNLVKMGEIHPRLIQKTAEMRRSQANTAMVLGWCG
ncbi:histidine kinase [Bifidobacterium sp. ESL0798]|nr:histidine kinase [Bifidobacterium sp. ESL0798]WEV74552.1 histidine kinase [Bifidobacterium sp. ESL0798]